MHASRRLMIIAQDPCVRASGRIVEGLEKEAGLRVQTDASAGQHGSPLDRAAAVAR